MRRDRIALIALLLSVALVAAFLWLDFRATKSETRDESRVSTFSSGTGEGARLQMGQRLALQVVGADEIARSLHLDLMRQLPNSPYIGQVLPLAHGAERAVGSAALVVEWRGRDLLWTPLYGRARVGVTVSYSSDGDLSWRHQFPVHMGNLNGPMVRVRGEIDVVDTTWGLASRRAYQRHVVEQVAATVSKGLDKALSSQAAGPTQ